MNWKTLPELRPVLWDGLVFLSIAALALGTLAVTWLRAGDSDRLTAVVSVDGREIDRAVLNGEETRTYSAGAYTLTVRFFPDGVQVESSDCPTQDCVHTGTIRKSGQTIICLPARLILRLEGREEESRVDAVLG